MHAAASPTRSHDGRRGMAGRPRQSTRDSRVVGGIAGGHGGASSLPVLTLFTSPVPAFVGKTRQSRSSFLDGIVGTARHWPRAFRNPHGGKMPEAGNDTKVAVVTGASSGIGQATAVELASRGYQVAVHYFSNEKGARRESTPATCPTRARWHRWPATSWPISGASMCW